MSSPGAGGLASARPVLLAAPVAAPFAFALCADDYAMAPGVSRGIREALDAGRLSATSVMTMFEDWPREAAALAPLAGRADIGLHLNLTLGHPLGAMPGLAPAGIFPTIGAMVRAARRGTLPRHEVAGEIDRQLDAFADAVGRPPDHVDGHQHVHVLAPVRDLLIDALARRGWRPWLRDSGDRPSRILRRRETLVKAAGVSVLAQGFGRRAEKAGFRTNGGFAGFSDFDETQPYADSFARYLTAAGPAHLVMCHPGHADDALRRLDPIVERREQELAFLLSPAFGIMLARHGARLARLSETLAKPSAFQP